MSKGDMAVVALILATIVGLDVMATRAILRDDLSERRQRLAQIALVWLFPLLGALLVLALYREPKKAFGTYAINRSAEFSIGDGDPYRSFPDLSGD